MLCAEPTHAVKSKMADAEDDEQFLYGDEPQEKGQSGEQRTIKTEKSETAQPRANGTAGSSQNGPTEDDSKEAGELSNEDEEEDDDDDDDDDDVQVTIGEINTAATGYGGPYSTPVNWNFKGGSAASASKPTPAGSKSVNVNAEGTVNGIGIYEFDLESAEDRPWRKPGADITDYFNYGFTEDTWKQYCEKQRRMRMDLSIQKKIFSHHVAPPAAGPINMVPGMIPMDVHGPRKAGPPPERKLEGSIDVIGAIGSRVESRRHDDDMPPHMMGDGGPPDMGMPHPRGMPKRGFPAGAPGGPGLPPGGPPPFHPATSDPSMGPPPPISGPPPTSMAGPSIPVHHGMPPQFPPGRHDMPPPGGPPGMMPPGMAQHPPPHGMPPGFHPDQGPMPFDPMGFPGRHPGGMRGRGRGQGFPHPGMPGMPPPGEFPPGMDERGPRMGFEEGMPPFFPGDPNMPFPPMMHGMPWEAGLGRGFLPNFGRDGLPMGMMRPGGESPGRMRSDEDSEYGSSEDERKREHKKRDKDKERSSREHRERTRERHSERDRSPRRDRDRRDRESSRRHRDRDKEREKGGERDRDREKREERSSRRERSKDTREKKRQKASSEAASTDGQEEGELVPKKKSRRSREEKKEAKVKIEPAPEPEEGQLSS